MKYYIGGLSLLALFACAHAEPAQAQQSTVVTTCGTQSIPLAQGTSGGFIDATGNYCTNATGGGGGGGNVNLTGINGVTPLVGAGATGTGSARTTQAQDTSTVAGAAPLTTGIYVTGPSAAALSTSALQTTSNTNTGAISTNLGTTADSACATDNGTCTAIALIKRGNQNATTLNTTAAGAVAAGTNRIGYVSDDPCSQLTKLGAPISLTASGQVITGTAATKIYVCSIDLVSATAQNIALVEGTGTVCATNIFGLAGGTTAATGWNLAANGGLTKGGGNGTVYSPSADSNATAANVCLLLSSTGQTSGQITYVKQ